MIRRPPRSTLFPSPTLSRSDDQTHAAVLSPAANYMIASMRGDGKAEIASGLNKGVAALPAGFTHSTLMALGVGVNADRKSTRLNSSHSQISYAVFCLKKKKQ